MFVMMKHYQVHSEKTRQGQGVQKKLSTLLHKMYIYVIDVWNISMILVNGWLSNVRFENLWISSVKKRFRSTTLKFVWLFLFGFFWYEVINYLRYSNWFKKETSLTLESNSETYSKPPRWRFLQKKWTTFNFWLFFAKSFISDVRQDSEFTSEAINDLLKKLHLRC